MRFALLLLLLLVLPVVVAVDFDFYVGSGDPSVTTDYVVHTCQDRELQPYVPGEGVYHCTGGFQTQWTFVQSKPGTYTVVLGHSSKVLAYVEQHCDSNRYAIGVWDGLNRVYFRDWLGDGHWGPENSYGYFEMGAVGDRVWVYDMQMQPGSPFYNEDSVETRCEHRFKFFFDVLMNSSEHSSSVTKWDTPYKTLGILRELHDASGGGSFGVWSSNPKVLVFFGPHESNMFSTNINAEVHACVDANENGECDFYELEERLAVCRPNKDYYKSGLPGESDACCGDAPYVACDFYADKQAVCGRNSLGQWRWAPLLEPGVIADLSGCWNVSFSIVSNGSRYFGCGGSPAVPIDYTSVGDNDKVLIAGHDYYCIDDEFIECAGAGAYSEFARDAGTTLTVNNVVLYCRGDGGWSSSLDGDELGCDAAGFGWTGTKCCGEVDDSPATFEDFGLIGEGVCVDNVFIPNGETISDSILVYFGTFVECDPALSGDVFRRSTSALFPNVYPFVHGVCGTYLAQALYDESAVCMPNGHWHLRDVGKYTFEKSTAWTPRPNDLAEGCCGADECWAGTHCIAQGDYINVDGEGYRCG